MRSGIVVSLAFGLLGADLAAASVCRPQYSSTSSVVTDASLTTSSETKHASSSVSTAAESSTASTTISAVSSDTTYTSTSEISSSAAVSTSISTAESGSTSSSEVVSESATTFTTRTTAAESATTSSSEVASDSSTTAAESTTASTAVESSTTAESSTTLITTIESATTDSSTTVSSEVTSTSSAPFANPTFYLQANGGSLDGETVQNDPTKFRIESFILPATSGFSNTPVYVEEGTGRLKTLFDDNYLCISGELSRQVGALLPAEVQLCNTWRIANGLTNRYQYLTCQLAGNDGISCSVQGVSCLIYSDGRNDNFRCDLKPEVSFTQFSTRYVSGLGYLLHLGPEGAFDGYETVEFKRKVVEQS